MESITPRDPRTGTPGPPVPVSSPEEVRAAVERGRKSFADWGSRPWSERRVYLKQLKKAIVDNIDHIVGVVVSETGKEEGEAVLGDIITALAVCDYYQRRGGKLLRGEKGDRWPLATVKGWVEYEPLGVAAVISPWNYPFYLTMGPAFTAVAAGCAVVAKPSEVTPRSGALVAELAADAGLPEHLVQVVHGPGTTGAALVESGADVIAFTGSTPVGKKIATAAAKTLTPVILELGGNDAMVVAADANVKAAARTAVWAGMFNAGQTCVGVERVYVVDEAYEPFVEALDRAMRDVDAGSGGRGDIGPIIHPPQIDLVEGHVRDALAKGARIMRGGERTDRNGGIYYQPTVLVDVDHSMEVMRHETFGPVLGVMRVPDEETALELAGDSYHGLHGSVWSRSRKRARRLASQLESGSVAINDHTLNFLYPSIQLAGAKESGYGGQMGPNGIRSYCHPKGVTLPRGGMPTTWLLRARLPRAAGVRYWKALARTLFGR